MYLEKFNGFTSEGRAELQDNRGFDEDSEFRELNRTFSVQVGSAPYLYRKLSCQKKMYVKKHIHTWNANASEMLLLFFNFF